MRHMAIRSLLAVVAEAGGSCVLCCSVHACHFIACISYTKCLGEVEGEKEEPSPMFRPFLEKEMGES